jgi:transposase InsO family protein
MIAHTTPRQRQQFFVLHQGGETYQQIGERFSVSAECVRYWCRRQRDGGTCQTTYHREAAGLLGRFDPKVRFCVLRLRLEHRRWGPNRIRKKLQRRVSLRGTRIPSEASIGRYLHRWPRFHRRRKQQIVRVRPYQPVAVHQRWQLDFKLGIALQDGTLVNLHTVRDPFGEVCIGAFVSPAGRVGHIPRRVTFSEIQSTLRACFARWSTLPVELQTDAEPVLVGQPQDTFPSRFTLWLRGFGIDHLVIRPGKPTDNAEVERCHRTLMDYAIVGNENVTIDQLQTILDQAVYELAFELPSRAASCHGQPPVSAHPELLQPRRRFQPEHELALFDLGRVDAYLATFTWERRVGKTGQINLGGQHQVYSVGRSYACRQVWVRFDPADRHFVFYQDESAEREIRRRPARSLDLTDLTGLAFWPTGLKLQQLALPLSIPDLQGVRIQ